MLTFDGGAKAGDLIGLLNTLETERIDASFFLPGSWIAHHSEKARLLVRAGHVLGNRGYTDSDFTNLSDEAIAYSIAQSEEQLRAVGARPRPFMRLPRGSRDLRVLSNLASMGYRSVRWTQHPGGGLARKIANKVVGGVRAGSIISLEPARTSHLKAVPMIIEGLRDRRFEFRTIETLERSHAIRWDVTMSNGSSGSDVTYLQKKLNSTSYQAGPADGSFGYETLQAVYAYQKVHGLSRDGIVSPLLMESIAVTPRPPAPNRKPDTFIDVDIPRQVLFEVKDGRVLHTIPISSGNEAYYEQDGQTNKAHTPRGDFVIERKIPGWRESDLGQLWYPSYFYSGFAIHGSESVPTYPASHGCVRIPMYSTVPFYNRNPIGTPVFVHD